VLGEGWTDRVGVGDVPVTVLGQGRLLGRRRLGVLSTLLQCLTIAWYGCDGGDGAVEGDVRQEGVGSGVGLEVRLHVGVRGEGLGGQRRGRGSACRVLSPKGRRQWGVEGAVAGKGGGVGRTGKAGSKG
jgi:hypothetical protein